MAILNCEIHSYQPPVAVFIPSTSELENELSYAEWEVFSFSPELHLHNILLLKKHKEQFNLIDPHSDEIWKNVRYYCKKCIEEKFGYSVTFLKN
jgi:hypothetical protein